jgi:hypothetical protein
LFSRIFTVEHYSLHDLGGFLVPLLLALRIVHLSQQQDLYCHVDMVILSPHISTHAVTTTMIINLCHVKSSRNRFPTQFTSLSRPPNTSDTRTVHGMAYTVSVHFNQSNYPTPRVVQSQHKTEPGRSPISGRSKWSARRQVGSLTPPETNSGNPTHSHK